LPVNKQIKLLDTISLFVIAFQMFKGFEKVKDVQYIYTPFDSSLCGVKLEAGSQKQYLLTGKLNTSNCPDSLS
jgi:hypothetical protein